MSTQTHPSASVESPLPAHEDTDELQDAIYTRDPEFFKTHSGKEITSIAKALNWNDYDFQSHYPKRRPRATTLEEVNNTTLAVLAPDGKVYQMGDTIRFETKRCKSGWGRSRSNKTTTYENRIDHLSPHSASISRMPTYSNTPRDSPSAQFAKTEIKLVNRSNLDKYRDRLTEGTDIGIPKSINGWTLIETDEYSIDSDLLPDNLITKMRWSNGESTNITAKWRGSYRTWYLSTPVDGVLCDDNADEYLYEIDVNHEVVRSETVISLARYVMNQLDPEDFQQPYDLRDPNTVDKPAKRLADSPPVEFPDQIGDWSIIQRNKGSIKYANHTPNSPWEGFETKIDLHGGVSIWNANTEESHDRRLIKKHFPNGDPHPENINTEGYGWRSRNLFEDHWHYGIAFLIQTSINDVQSNTLEKLQDQAPDNTNLETFDHKLSTDHNQTTDRENETLFAYQN